MNLPRVIFLAAALGFLLPSETKAGSELDYRKEGENYLLVLKPGQRVLESLIALTAAEKLPGAAFMAIGAVKDVDVAYYNTKTKKYQPKTFSGSKEVLALTGSMGYFEGQPVVHAHLAFSGPDFKVYGGHLREATVSVVLEVFVFPTKKAIIRTPNPVHPGLKSIELGLTTCPL